MSATKAEQDWRWIRAWCAVDAIVKGNSDGHIPFAYYADIFDLDEEETKELFNDVAVRMQVRITVLPDPTYH